MKLILPALLFTLFLVAPTLHADSVITTYVATDTLTSATATSESWAWTFTGPQEVFGFSVDFAPSPPSFGDRWVNSGGCCFAVISGTPITDFSFGLAIDHLAGIDRPANDCFLTGNTTGFVPCDPGRVNVWDAQVINTSLSDGSPLFSDGNRILIGSFPIGAPPPTATPEPASLVLFGSGIIGLVFGRRFIS